MEINPYRLFNCPLAPKEKDSAFLYVFFSCLTDVAFFPQLCEQLRQRENKQSHKNVRYAVNDIKRYPRDYPRKRLFKSKTEHDRLTGREKRSEKEAVKRANGGINDPRRAA